MTAIAARRQRSTAVGAVAAGILVVVALVMFVVGANTLSNSEAGEAVGIDERPQRQFPETPNALLTVEDDNGDLSSLAVMTLLPSGQGGSIVPVRIDADATAGSATQAVPIAADFDPADIEAFVASVEQMLAITLQRVAVVDATMLASLIEPADTAALSPLAETGPDADVAHATQVAVWDALAAAAPVPASADPVPTDDLGRPIAPTTVEELLGRLFAGSVAVRDLAVTPTTPERVTAGASTVVIDRVDTVLVFAQVSPSLVSTPNPGLKVRVLVPFTDEQLSESDGLFTSSSEVAVRFIRQMLFVQANVVSIDVAPDGAAEETTIDVASAQTIDAVTETATDLFGEADVRLADEVLEGVDIEVTLGMSYIAGEVDAAAGDPAAPVSVPVTDTVGGDE